MQYWPGQVVVAGSQTHWTRQVSEALEKKEINKYHKQQLHELDELRELVRGELTDNARETLKALIVIEVHARDVVINLIEEKVMNVNDFEWISQVTFARLVLMGGIDFPLARLTSSYGTIGMTNTCTFERSTPNFAMATNTWEIRHAW